MNLRCRRNSFCVTMLVALAALLFTGTLARAQHFFQLDWGGGFNNSAANDPEDNWVANSFPISNADRTHVVSISLPIGDAFTNQSISALIYQGFDLQDPTVGRGLVLKSRTDTTFTSSPGTIITVTLDTPADFNVGDIVYVAVMIPGVPPTKFPFYSDTGTGSGLGGLLKTTALGRSFFDVGLSIGGTWDVNQGSDFITVLGGTHPLLGPGVQSPGNLALWASATSGM
jgi:hypothetical protein